MKNAKFLRIIKYLSLAMKECGGETFAFIAKLKFIIYVFCASLQESQITHRFQWSFLLGVDNGKLRVILIVYFVDHY